MRRKQLSDILVLIEVSMEIRKYRTKKVEMAGRIETRKRE
jgi:hypothetical protein